MLAYLILIGAFCLLLAIGDAVTEWLCEIFPSIDKLLCDREEFEEE